MSTQHCSFETVLARIVAKRNAEVTPRSGIRPTETTLDEQVRIFGRVKARNESRPVEVTPQVVRRRIRDLVSAYGLK